MARKRFRGRCFTDLINILHLSTGAEVGVCEKMFSETLLRYSKLKKLYSIDMWKYTDGTPMVKEMNECRTRLSEFGNRSEIIVSESVAAAAGFADNSLDFVYIDADHSYDGVTADINAWLPKVVPGGVISGHDYLDWTSRKKVKGKFYAETCDLRVKPAVDDFIKTHPYDLKTTRGINPSWWFIKK